MPGIGVGAAGRWVVGGEVRAAAGELVGGHAPAKIRWVWAVEELQGVKGIQFKGLIGAMEAWGWWFHGGRRAAAQMEGAAVYTE